MEHSAKFYRGAVAALNRAQRDFTVTVPELQAEYVDLLAEAEAREASVPTAADLAVADELDMLAAHIQEYIGPDDARDDIRRICRNRAEDLRRGVKRGPTAAEVIAAAEKALARTADHIFDSSPYEVCIKNCPECLRVDAIAAIAKWKEANRLREGK